MPIQEFLTPEIIVSFLTLTFLEIVLAGDNLVLIAILAGRLPEPQRPLARRLGLIAAVVTRLGLLATLFWLAHLQRPFAVELPGLPTFSVTPRELVLGIGGFFLIWKSLSEISTIFGGGDAKARAVQPLRHAFAFTILQIAIFDMVFSLDSVVAAIGIAQRIEVMAAAIVTAALLMLFLVNPISDFIDRHRIVRLIALNFLTLVGALLIAEAANLQVPHVYFYAALAVAIVIQVVALWLLAWTPGVQRTVTLLLVAAAIVTAFGVVLDINKDTQAAAQVYAVLDGLWSDGSSAIGNAYEWVRGR